MSLEKLTFVCQCSEHGSIDLHRDERETLVKIGDILYELVPSTRTFAEILELPEKEVPHVRHLNPIPLRTRAEQKAYSEKSAHRTLEAAREIVKEKATKEYEVQKAKVAGEPKKKRKPRESKCRLVVEELHKRAMTIKDMMMFEIAKSTAETFKYDLKRAGYELLEGEVDGEKTLKILGDPVKK